jgi:hypothetical protein
MAQSWLGSEGRALLCAVVDKEGGTKWAGPLDTQEIDVGEGGSATAQGWPWDKGEQQH